MPRKNNKRIIKDSDDELTENEYSETPNNRYWSASSESETSDNENSESENENEEYDTEGYDTEENIEKVMDNDISDETLKSKEDDINLLSDNFNKMSVEDPNVYKLSNKPLDECNKIFLEFIKDKYYSNKKYQGKTCEFVNKDNRNTGIKYLKIGDEIDKSTEYLNILKVNPGSLMFKKDEFEQFLQLENDVVCHPDFKPDFNKFKLFFREWLPLVCPLLIDVDIKHTNIIKEGRIYNYIDSEIIKICNDILKEHYNIDNPYYYLFEKEKATYVEKQKEKYYKDGIHLIYLYPFKSDEIQFIIEELRNRLKNNNNYKEMIKNNKILEGLDKIIDNCVSNNQPFMMYNNTKFLNNKISDYYKLIEIKSNINPTFDKNYSIPFFSYYQYYLNNTESLKLIKSFNEMEIESGSSPKSKKQKMEIEEDIDIDTIKNNSSDDEAEKELENIINTKYLTLEKVKNINSRFTLDDIRRLIDIINLKYAEDENYWFQIYYSIYSYKEVHYELLEDIKNEMDYFSSKSRQKYAKSDNENALKNYKQGKISLNNLVKFAFKSNKEEAKKIYKEMKRRNKILKDMEELNNIKKYDTTLKSSTKEIINIPKDEIFNYDRLYYLFNTDILECLNYWYKFNYYTSIKNAKGENVDIIFRLKKITKEKEVFNNELHKYTKKKYNKYEFEKITSLNSEIPKTHYKILLSEEIEKIRTINNINYRDIEKIITKDNKIVLKDLIMHTLPFNKYKSFNDINAPILYQIKYYNQYDYHFRTERYINFNKIAIEFYFNDILSCDKPEITINDYGVNEICSFIKNYVCCKDDEEIYEEVDENIKKVIDDKYNYIMNFFKTIFLRKRNNTILCLTGAQGTGKSTLSHLINKILKYNISHTDQGSAVFSQFNKYKSGLFFGIEELEITDKKNNENNFAKLKNDITNSRVDINLKGIESEDTKNVCNYIITSNNINLFKLETSDRRTVIMHMFKRPKEGKNYFINLYKIIKNKECLINFYNYVKYSTFGGYNDIDIFRNQDALITDEKEQLTINTSDTYNKFLISFYNQLNYAKLHNEKLKNEFLKDIFVDENNKVIYNKDKIDKIDNKKSIKYICLTIPRFYKSYKNYCSRILQFSESQCFKIENFKTYITNDKLIGYPPIAEQNFKKSTNKYVFTTEDYLNKLLIDKRLSNEIIDFSDKNYADEFDNFDY